MNKIAKQFLVVGVCLIAIMAGVLAWAWKSLPPKIPLFFSLPWGDQQLVDKIDFAYVLAGSLLLLIVTRLLSKWAGKDDDIVEVVIMAGGLTAVILLGATFFRVIQIFIGI